MFLNLALNAIFNGFIIALSLTVGSDWSTSWRVTIIIGAVSLFTFINYRQITMPGFRVKEKTAEILISTFLLDALLKAYKIKQPGSYNLRACVLKRKRKLRIEKWRIRMVDNLNIRYSTPGYPAAEKELVYEDYGASGNAVIENNVVYYDKKTAPTSISGMPATHIEITKHINSVLSAPIYRLNDTNLENPIGILSIDSKTSVEKTGFHDPTNYDIVTSMATLIGSFMV